MNRSPLLLLLLLIPLLAYAGSEVRARVAESARYQEAIREAQIVRSHAFALQLDEETGVRGFTSTGDVRFLEPFNGAQPLEIAALKKLQASLVQVGLQDAVPLVEDERRENAQWIHAIATPLIKNPDRSPQMTTIQRNGKDVIDAFRADDLQLQNRLQDAAEQADRALQKSILYIIIYNAIAMSVALGLIALFVYLQNRAARESFRNRVLFENERRITDTLQQAFLAKELPAIPAIALSAVYAPASQQAQVGGDWYDAFELPDERLLFTIGDVSGHGITSAVVMARARQAIISSALQNGDPASILRQVNTSLLLQGTTMVTAICGLVDLRTNEVTYASAGHPPAILATPGLASRFLSHGGVPLGVFDAVTYTNVSLEPQKDDLLILYPDGLVEYARDVRVGEVRLLEVAQQVARDAVGRDSAATIRSHVFASQSAFDDVAILTLRFVHASSLRSRPAEAGERVLPSGLPDAGGRRDFAARSLLPSYLRPVARSGWPAPPVLRRHGGGRLPTIGRAHGNPRDPERET